MKADFSGAAGAGNVNSGGWERRCQGDDLATVARCCAGVRDVADKIRILPVDWRCGGPILKAKTLELINRANPDLGNSYTALPEVIQAEICAFKVERHRTPQ